MSAARRGATRKYERVLRALLGGAKNSRELEGPPTFDHCAASTIAELKKKHRIEISAELETIPGYAGLPAHVARYQLTPAGRAAAEQLLASR